MQPVQAQAVRTHNGKRRRQPRQPAGRQTCGATMTWTWKDCRTRNGAWASTGRRELEAGRHGALAPPGRRKDKSNVATSGIKSPLNTRLGNGQAQPARPLRRRCMSCMVMWRELGLEQPSPLSATASHKKGALLHTDRDPCPTAAALRSRHPDKRSIINAFRLAGDGTRVQTPSCTATHAGRRRGLR